MSSSAKRVFSVHLLKVLTLLLPLLGINAKALAQSITATPDGTGTIINPNGNTYNITGGTQSEANLFHSFAEFGLNPQEIANFLSNPNINNIIGRVTGGNPSIIQGLIQLSGSNSNLFLMNPAGWVFNQGASLDVPGSFGVTTATRMGFGDGFFNAYGDNTYSNLTGNPTHLIFDQSNPSWIINEGNLEVNPGENLWAVGGGIISTGTVEAEGGEITLAAVPGESQIKLSHEGMVLNLILDAAPIEGTVVLPNTTVGIQSVDIPRYLTGGSNMGHVNEVIFDKNGNIQLVNGDNIIAGEINAEATTLMAAGRVTPTQENLISNPPTVVRFPEEIGANVETTFIDEGIEDYQSFLYGGKPGTIS
ncbi:MAG: filamentous hemagglutinin N-terminal domain-containing protein, partial [Cyanobacteriota bacterium]|nr:filamentous hemagglutinin N-terminal domain-containing protein [Cyanobacteriota bacterium]